MVDAFLLGAGFSKALYYCMPTMTELYESLEALVHIPDGIPQETYDYAAGDAEALLSYYAIPSPQDDLVEVFRKKRLTELIERGIGTSIAKQEYQAHSSGPNTAGIELLSKWHRDQSHILTTNYDTLVETLAGTEQFRDENTVRPLNYQDLYPIPITPAHALRGAGFFGTTDVETFTLYKLHGSTSWYTPAAESNLLPYIGYPKNYSAPQGATNSLQTSAGS